MSKTSSPVRPSDSHDWPARSCSGRNAHAHQVAAVDALEARGDHRADAQQECPLGGPVAAAAGAVFRAGQHHQRHAFGLVLHGGVVDRHELAVGQMPRDAAFGAGGQQVADADVGERAPGHHPIVAAPRAVAVEIDRRDAVLLQILARPGCWRRSSRPAKCGRWSPNRPAPPARGRRGSAGSAPARRPDRAGTAAPGCTCSLGSHGNSSLSATGRCDSTSRSPRNTLRVSLRNISGRTDCGDRWSISAWARPDVLQIDRLAVAADAQRLAWSGRYRSCRPGRRPRPAAGWPGSWPSPAD